MIYLKRFFVLFIISVLIISAASGQDYSISSVFGLMEKGTNQIVRDRSYQINIKSKSKATIYYKVATTYFKKPDDLDDLDFVITESSFSKIKSLQGKVYDSGGKVIRKSQKSDVKEYGSAREYEFTDTRYKVLNMGIAEPPFTVEYIYRKEYDGFFMMPDWTIQRLGEAVEHTSYEVQYPESFEFTAFPKNIDVAPTEEVKGQKKVWSAAFKNMKSIKKESNTPYFKNIYRSVEFIQKEIQMGEYSGKFKTWEDFSSFSYALNKDREKLTAIQTNEVKKILASCSGSDTKSKIACLYKYMQENYRYVSVQIGVGGWQTMNASEVMVKKYGDCKALSHLMKGMLAVAGIPAYSAWVYGGNSCPKMDSKHTSSYFNHCILYVPREDMWLECTSQDAPPGYLGSFTADRPALLLKESGGALVQTSEPNPEDHQVNIAGSVKIESKGTAQIDISEKRSGSLHQYHRYIDANFDGEELERKLLKNLEFRIQKLNTLNLEIDEYEPISTLNIDATVRRFALSSGKRMFIPITKLDKWERDFSSDEKRTLPFELDYAYKRTMDITIQMPADYKAESLPDAVTLESKYGSYKIEVSKIDESTLSIKREINMPALKLEPEEFEAANDFFKKASKADGAKIILLSQKA